MSLIANCITEIRIKKILGEHLKQIRKEIGVKQRVPFIAGCKNPGYITSEIYYPKDCKSTIRINREFWSAPLETQIRCIAHEFAHVKQHEQEDIYFGENNEKYIDISINPFGYQMQLAEINAEARAVMYIRKYVNRNALADKNEIIAKEIEAEIRKIENGNSIGGIET